MDADRGHRAPPTGAERVALGLGSNLGDRRQHLRHGLFALVMHPELAVRAFSRVWESQHVGEGEQAPYLNMVCLAETRLAPGALLAVCQGIEQRLGRPPDSHGRPRTLDLDILLFGERRGADPELVLPHPRLGERGFVLGPLADVAPLLRLPDSGETAAAAWARIRAQEGPWLHPLAEPLLERQPAAAGEEEWRAALAVHCR
jgi:2-amino-4-hydroxy-6-hydroxymethyldihydropteridine diphosphokinase